MKCIYFADCMGNLEQEKNSIQQILSDEGIDLNIEIRDTPPFKEYFDVLFFDWGGMSIGNSLLEHFCGYIIDHAREHPNRVYIMTSLFTRDAMDDLREEIKYETEEFPANIFLEIEAAIPLLKAWK